MPDKTSYSPGEPIWVDLGSPDLAASRTFYGSLFGWTAEEGNPDFGGYTNFELGGRKVAGLMPLMAPGQPPAWQCYVCTDDVEKTSALVAEAGGTVIAAAMQVGDLGTMAVYTDPTGAFFGVWQPALHLGTEVVGEEGTTAWIELSTRDQAAAVSFYGSVFGWTTASPESYTEFQLAGQSVAGCMDTPEGVPAEVPSHWLPYFVAGDPAAKAAQAVELGASLVVPFMEFPGGTFAVVQDPHGATFGLLAMTG